MLYSSPYHPGYSGVDFAGASEIVLVLSGERAPVSGVGNTVLCPTPTLSPTHSSRFFEEYVSNP